MSSPGKYPRGPTRVVELEYVFDGKAYRYETWIEENAGVALYVDPQDPAHPSRIDRNPGRRWIFLAVVSLVLAIIATAGPWIGFPLPKKRAR